MGRAEGRRGFSRGPGRSLLRTRAREVLNISTHLCGQRLMSHPWASFLFLVLRHRTRGAPPPLLSSALPVCSALVPIGSLSLEELGHVLVTRQHNSRVDFWMYCHQWESLPSVSIIMTEFNMFQWRVFEGWKHLRCPAQLPRRTRANQR